MREQSGWPTNRWELSAPESYSLLYGPEGDRKQPFKLAVLELVSRKVLSLVEVEERGYFGAKTTAVLADGPEKGRPLESRPLRAVVGIYDRIAKSSFPNGVTGVPVADLARETIKRHKSLKKFVETEVMSALEARGFYRREDYRILWIIPATRWNLTPSGEAARAELDGTTKLGERSFGEWVDRDPSHALAFLGVAGPSILLMDAIHPDLQRLREEGEATGYVGGVYTGSSDGGNEDTFEGDASSSDASFEPGGLDFGSLDLDFGSLGDLGGALDSIDAGVDAGGGGDGGGGDGGGGGGNGGGGGG